MEKPIALREHDAIEIVQEAAARGLVLAVVSQHRYDPVVRSVKRWIDGGLLGDIACVTVQLECSRDRAYYTTSDWRGTWCGEGGSVLINQGYHCVDVLRWLCGPIGDVAAMLGTVRLGDTIETEDTFSATLRLKCGGLATLAITSAGTRLWQSRIQVVGTGGTVTFDLDHPGKIHEWSGTHALARRATKLAAELDRVGLPPGVDYYGVSHRSQVADFCRAVETGQALEVSPGDAIETLRVIGRLYSSAIWQSAVREAVDAKELWC
jgi:predicted dehydrogenase